MARACVNRYVGGRIAGGEVKLVFVLDDNMPLRSMRHEYFLLARRCECRAAGSCYCVSSLWDSGSKFLFNLYRLKEQVIRTMFSFIYCVNTIRWLFYLRNVFPLNSQIRVFVFPPSISPHQD